MTLFKCRRLLPSVVRSSLLAASMLLVTGVGVAATSAHPAVIKQNTNTMLSKNAADYWKGIRITASPLLGTYTYYDMSALLTNQPTMNEDLTLLEQHQMLDNKLQAMGSKSPYAYPNTPLIDVSGRIEPWFRPGFDNYQSQYASTVVLEDAELDFGVYASRWITGYLSIGYGDAGHGKPDPGFDFKRAWVTVGNLNQLPVYGSLGKMYIPFGVYSSNMLTDPLTKTMFRMNDSAAVVGYSGQMGGANGKLYAQGYLFDDRIKKDPKTEHDHIAAGGVNIGYSNKYANHIGFDLGAGIVSDISSGGISSGLSSGTDSQTVHKHVPGLDVHANTSWNSFGLTAEFISALTRYNSADFSYQDKDKANSSLEGALPMALHTEFSYNFSWGSNRARQHPTTVFAAYDHSWEALALTDADGSPRSLPEQSIAGGISTSFFRYTITGLEYRFDQAYSTSQQSGTATDTATNQTIAGKHQNTLTLLMGLYF